MSLQYWHRERHYPQITARKVQVLHYGRKTKCNKNLKSGVALDLHARKALTSLLLKIFLRCPGKATADLV